MNRSYKNVRTYLKWKDHDPQAYELLMKMTRKFLGIRDTEHHAMDAALEELMREPSGDLNKYVLFPSYTWKDDGPWFAGAIYDAKSVYEACGKRIGRWDALFGAYVSPSITRSLREQLFRLDPEERQELFELGRQLPEPLSLDQVPNPLDIRVSGSRFAAYVLAWSLRDRPWAEDPEPPQLLLPIGPSEQATPEDLYAAFSRYIQVLRGADHFMIENIKREIRADLAELCRRHSIDGYSYLEEEEDCADEEGSCERE